MPELPRLRAALAVCLLVALAGCATSGAPVGSRLPDAAAHAEADGLAPFDTTALNFLVVGDWGRNGFFNQREVARGMGEIGGPIRSRFTISTGDNFYTSGVSSTNDVRWERSFEDIYTAPALQSRWYAVLGNHDWQGNVPAQIAYTRRSDRWYMPAQYYAEEMTLGDDSTRALFVFLDTNPLAYPPEDRRRYSSTGDWDPEGQIAWLERTLAASDTPWKIVVGHHPIYVGSTSYSDNPRLVDSLVPLFERHGVQAYFAGHDHNLQHHRPPGSNVDYFVSGAGSLTREVIQTPNTLFALRTPGFMAVSLTADVMAVHAHDADGRLVYRADVPRRRGARLPLPFGISSEPSGGD
ncbi:purple acid phosphatase family protein [Rubrivirga litoralis]|uniref:acid phosphatase n=1 Tax=Rubrivirga litoralis TaxID=3075598 RepID=A0ABU3BQK7_9BACT|nr:tartrate-resistant acid phosphatase type 5 family protein [Rubrivirga sp. F394]MDT0631575.1 tartrate-resistant acid phosphatase type 5 family protein [Rubrivirga sp. F394]